MNREIKFRAFYGNRMYGNQEALRILYNNSAGMTTLPNAVIMQFTGLKDRNGKEIYEGDILRHDSMYILKFHETGQVVYEPACGDFIVNGKWSKNQHHENLDCDIAEICEVIGNIHEHANLLATAKG